MARIIAIDYGKKRCGLAWTDPLQIIATGLKTVAAHELLSHLIKLSTTEDIEAFILGLPLNLEGEETDSTKAVMTFKGKLEKQFPGKDVHFWDERFTSKNAVQAMIQAGVPKKKRRNKALVDQVAATLILQEYLESRI